MYHEPPITHHLSKQRRQWLILAVALLIFAASIAVDIVLRYQRTGEREAARLHGQAKVVGDNLVQNLISLNMVLAQIQAQQAAGSSDLSTNEHLKILSQAMPGVRTLLITDRTGMAVAASKPDVIVGKNFAHRDYFSIPKAAPDPAILYLSPPFKTLTGVYVINATRILVGPDGFAGVVSATLDPEYFRVLLSSVQYAADVRTAIIHGDGTLFMMVPENPGLVGKNLLQQGTLFAEHLRSGRTTNVYSGQFRSTGRNGMVVTATIGHELKTDRPLVVTISRSLSEVYAQWRRDTLLSSAFFLLTALAASAALWRHQLRQRQYEAAQLLAEERRRKFENLIENSNDAIYSKSLDGTVLTWNRAAEQMYGYSAGEIIGSNVARLFEPGQPTEMTLFMDRLLRGEKVQHYETVRLRKDGSRIHVSLTLSPITDASGSIIEVSMIARDITQQKLAQEALVAKEHFLRQLAEHLPGMVGYWDAEMRCGFSNKEYLKWFGRSAEEMRGIHIRDLMGEELFSKNEPFIKGALAGQRQSFERTLVKSDGSTGYTWAQYLPDEVDGQVKGFFVLVSDITDLKQAELALRDQRDALELRTAELEKALAEIRQLQGILPICASCKKIRDDHGSWSQLEVYISEHSEAEFSHGMCPDCAKKLYPEQYARIAARAGHPAEE